MIRLLHIENLHPGVESFMDYVIQCFELLLLLEDIVHQNVKKKLIIYIKGESGSMKKNDIPFLTVVTRFVSDIRISHLTQKINGLVF